MQQEEEEFEGLDEEQQQKRSQLYNILLTTSDTMDFVKYSPTLTAAAMSTNIGKGRGKLKNKQRITLQHIDLYSQWCYDMDKFEKILHITKDEFDFILEQIEKKDFHRSSLLSMSVANKVLLSLHFVIQYTGANNLACLFNVSDYYVSKVLDEVFPYLVEFFVQFVPNKKIHETRSRLHSKLKFIIDGTLHKKQKLPGNVDEDYNGHYKMHGKLTQILLDYDGYVISFMTNIKGRIHDSMAALYNKDFKRIVGNNFALGDPGFAGVDYVISGFKPTSLQTWEQYVFDAISRQEQVMIENANKFIKENKSVNKQDTFKHGEHRLLACVFISIGLYNLKKDWGYFQ